MSPYDFLPFLPAWVPSIIQVLPFVAAFAIGCSDMLHKHPHPFYWVFAIAAVCSLFEGVYESIAILIWIEKLLVSPYTGVSFYLLVMFAGAFDPHLWWVKRLLRVRSELSIIGGMAIAAHIVRVLPLIGMSVMGAYDGYGSVGIAMVVANGVVGPCLFAFFLILWITSFPPIRADINPSTWKRLQRLAYPFLALMLLQGFLLNISHATLMMPRLALAGYPGGDLAIRYALGASFYAAAGALYLMLKLPQCKAKTESPRRTGAEGNTEEQSKDA